MEGRAEGEKGLTLFGVRIVDGESRWKQGAAMDEGKDEAMKKPILKSSSMVNLPVCEGTDAGEKIVDHGYLSESGMNQTVGRRGQRKKRGVKWTEEEHHTFLAGLERLGKGDWRGIARNFVVTRTPTQVASHAQKYFLRKSNPLNKKRRSSLFDVEISNKIFPAQSSPPNQRPATLDQTASAYLNRSNSSIRSANLELTIAPPQSGAVLAKFSSGIIKVI